MRFQTGKKTLLAILLLNTLLLAPDDTDRINSKTNLLALNQHIYILPEDFETGTIFDPIAPEEDSLRLHSQIDTFIASLAVKKIRREMIEENSFFFIQREIQENIFLANHSIKRYRIGPPRIIGNHAEINIKLFSESSTQGIVYCIKRNNSSNWEIEDIEIDYAGLKRPKTEKNSLFLPMPQGPENQLIP